MPIVLMLPMLADAIRSLLMMLMMLPPLFHAVSPRLCHAAVIAAAF